MTIAATVVLEREPLGRGARAEMLAEASLFVVGLILCFATRHSRGKSSEIHANRLESVKSALFHIG